jgi:hypothetical protein
MKYKKLDKGKYANIFGDFKGFMPAMKNDQWPMKTIGHGVKTTGTSMDKTLGQNAILDRRPVHDALLRK